MVTLSYSISDLDFRSTASVGIYNVARGLLQELASRPAVRRITVFSNHTLNGALALPPQVEVVSYDRAIESRWGRIAWDQWGVYGAARRTRNDWLFLPKGHTSFVRPCPAKLAVYLHDIIPLVYGERYPGATNRPRQAYFERVYAATLRRARLVFTNTAFTKGEIERWARERGIACPPVLVAGYGFSIGPRETAREDQILVFVRPDPHKRTDLAVNYLSTWMKQTHFVGRVVCVGALPPGTRLPAEPQWMFLVSTAAEFWSTRRSKIPAREGAVPTAGVAALLL